MARKKYGLRVKYCQNVATYTRGTNMLDKTAPDGWYVQAHGPKGWMALMNLPFRREKDALRAAQSLTVAGLDSMKPLKLADPLTVKQVACEMLQW